MFISYQLKERADGFADFSPLTLNLVLYHSQLQLLEFTLRLLKFSATFQNKANLKSRDNYLRYVIKDSKNLICCFKQFDFLNALK